jgi:hypothetical protein
MLHAPKSNNHPGMHQGRYAEAVARSAPFELIAEACEPYATLSRPGSARINQLIAAGAWTDVALALIELDLSEWTIRRLAYDGFEWHCSLTKHCAVPAEFDDDSVDGSHELLPLAIMSAFLEARRTNAAPACAPTVPLGRPIPRHPILCDNFA